MTLTESLTEFGEVKAHDVDECAEAHAPWEMNHTQLSLGQFRSQTKFVRNDRITVYRQRWNRKVLARGTSPADHVAVGTTTNASVQVNWCGGDLSSERLAWTQPSGEIDFATSELSDHVVALIRADVLSDYMGDAELAAEPHGLHMHCPEQRGRELVATIQSILTRYASQPSLLADPRECQDFESEVLSALVACADWGPSPEAHGSRRREAVRDASAYAETRSEPISVRQLANAVGVSPRTLEYAFREGLGTTPLNFMRRCRLNGALRELRSATRESKTVTEIATNWGFNDLGRFAAAYKQLFGFYPSQTLNQDRSLVERLQP
jgi:AraC family ethanolamine operon transcriptional activator